MLNNRRVLGVGSVLRRSVPEESLITAPRDQRAVYDITQALRGNHRPASPFGDADLCDHEGFGDDYDDRVVAADPLHQFVPTEEIPFADDDHEEEIEQRRPGGRVNSWNPWPPWQQVKERAAAVPVVDYKAARADLARRAEEARKAAGATPEKTFLTGTVVSQGRLGLTVETDDGVQIRVALEDERGHGTRTAAARWLFSHPIGDQVRVRIIRTNGHPYGVLDTRHRRPQGWLPPSQWRQSHLMEATAAN